MKNTAKTTGRRLVLMILGALCALCAILTATAVIFESQSRFLPLLSAVSALLVSAVAVALSRTQQKEDGAK